MGLYNVDLLVSAVLQLELGEFLGEDECFREKVEVGKPVLYLHLGYIFIHKILASYLE